MGTQVTIVLEEHALYRIDELMARLKDRFLTVDLKSRDYMIICRTNEQFTKRDITDMLSGLLELISAVHCNPTQDIDEKFLGEEYGFETAYDIIQKEKNGVSAKMCNEIKEIVNRDKMDFGDDIGGE